MDKTELYQAKYDAVKKLYPGMVSKQVKEILEAVENVEEPVEKKPLIIFPRVSPMPWRRSDNIGIFANGVTDNLGTIYNDVDADFVVAMPEVAMAAYDVVQECGGLIYIPSMNRLVVALKNAGAVGL